MKIEGQEACTIHFHPVTTFFIGFRDDLNVYIVHISIVHVPFSAIQHLHWKKSQKTKLV